jgi:SAM-dependent methyltransferase
MNTNRQSVCAVCSNSDWFALPTPGERSMTTAGRLVDDKLGKGMCRHCAAVQKVFTPRLADTNFYEHKYTYYDRPGAQSRDVVRYRALAHWVAKAIAPYRPTRVFDVGCGEGSTLTFLREIFPHAWFGGIEPSLMAVEKARMKGLDVMQGRIDRTPVAETFDLVFSNNVLQHTSDPVGFLKAKKSLLAPGGKLVLSCPDGTLPSIELLMADQNVSLRPVHVGAIAAKSGLVVEATSPCPGGPIRNEQLMVLSATQTGGPAMARDSFSMDPEEEFSKFTAYLNNWSNLDTHLCSKIGDAQRVFNFGGGLWSYALAAYCPNYWAKVESCLVDTFSGRCLDKEVVPIEQVKLDERDCLVLGTNPYVQAALIDRFLAAGLRAVSFQNMIPD